MVKCNIDDDRGNDVVNSYCEWSSASFLKRVRIWVPIGPCAVANDRRGPHRRDHRDGRRGRLSYEVSLHVKNTCGGQPGARLVASSTELRTAELLA